jgi:MerR family transcriptional regulator, light-induced transcriptional regulator
MKSHLSTQEVARMVAVTETTVKRWADEGKIPCHKTLGGHQKFLLKDILAFAEHHAYPLMGGTVPPLSKRQGEILEFSVQTKNYHKIAQLFYDEALQGDKQGLYELLTYLSKNRIAFATLADEVIRPAMVQIGERWQEGRLEIDQEHLASNALLEALIRLNAQLHRKPANGLSAVCACAEGDYHEIGLRMLAYALEVEGWNVHYLGANTPFDTLASFIKRRTPALTCISATIVNGNQRAVEGLRVIGQTAKAQRAAYLIGGLFLGEYSNNDLDCDFISASVNEAVDFVNDRFDLKVTPRKQQERA